ncbi:hypothetical protein RIF29_17359 [Crotalaria pallida]|uniref:Uncharacterized protein n=1 Tax=Crotalaria pallida TaxID=3830 RepID=A0AAN9FGY4_CROPI
MGHSLKKNSLIRYRQIAIGYLQTTNERHLLPATTKVYILAIEHDDDVRWRFGLQQRKVRGQMPLAMTSQTTRLKGRRSDVVSSGMIEGLRGGVHSFTSTKGGGLLSLGMPEG